MKRLLPLFAILLLAAACTYAAPAPVFAPAPRFAVTAAELAAQKAAPNFAAVRDAAAKAGDELVAKPVQLPDGFGSWIFYYACTDDGSPLQPLNLNEHQCPTCKKIYTDARTVAAYRCKLHYEAEYAAEKLGWAYAYTGNTAYAAGVKRILVKLATDYPTYPDRQDRWGMTGKLARLGGRRYVQSLDEAVGIVRLARGYDLTRDDAVWTDADRKLVEENLFRLTAATLFEFNQDINNHQTWYNAGLVAIGSVLGDAAIIDRVLTMRGGVYDQLKRSIGVDGLWYEGTMAYHNYALQAMFDIADGLKRLGINIATEPSFRAMIEGPLRAAYPNGQYPAINDSDSTTIQMFTRSFEWAWQEYKDPIFAQAAAWNNPARLKELLGPAAKPEWPWGRKSENLQDAGLAILRQGEGAGATCTFLDYGPHGGGHGHYDKLSLMLYANGREWLLDPGRLDYSQKEYKTWVKETAAHNTVALGQDSQQATTGKLLFLQQGKDFAACAAVSDGAYPGTVLTRYLLLTPKMLVDVYDVQATTDATIDWFAHAVVPAISPAEAGAPGRPEPPGEGHGYQHLTGGQAWDFTKTSRWDFVADDKDADAPRLRLWLAGDAPETVFTATGIGYYVHQKAPTLIRRRKGAPTRFVTVYDLSGKGDYVRQVTPGKVDLTKPPSVIVETAEGKKQVVFARESARFSAAR